MARRATTKQDETQEAPRLTNEQLVAAMALIKDADSVELKATVPVGHQRKAIRGLPMDPVEAIPRQVWFFDTPELTLNQAGVVVRARRTQGGKGDTVIKLRPVVPAELPASMRKDPAFNVEVDLLPGGFVCSGSFKGRTDGQAVRDVVNGKLALPKLFTKSQRAFYKEHAPAGIELESLVPLGPTFVLKGKFMAKTGLEGPRADRLLAAELWLYPDGSTIFELSTRCRPAETFQVAGEARAYLASRGVVLAAVQETKTKAALEFFITQLQTGVDSSI